MTTSALEDPPDSFVEARQDPPTAGPFAKILDFGRDAERTGQTIGMVLATGLHGLIALVSLLSLVDLHTFATLAQEAAQARFDTTVDIEVDEPEPVAEPEPEPEPPPPQEQEPQA